MQDENGRTLNGHDATHTRKILRGLISGERCIAPLSVFDPISGRIAQDVGGEVMMLAGSVASMVCLGDPDEMTLTLPELASLSGSIAQSNSLPLIVDADHGFGNALNVRRTVQELERAGVAALTIEDTLLPKAFGSDQRSQLISTAEACGKLKAALDARKDPNLIIIGRTGAAGLDDLDDAVLRLKAFEDVGVDMVFVRGVETRDQLEHISQAVSIPIFLSTTNIALRNLDDLSKTNVRIVLRGHRPIMAAYHAVMRAMQADIDGTEFSEVLSKEAIRRLTHSDEFEELNQKYLGAN